MAEEKKVLKKAEYPSNSKMTKKPEEKIREVKKVTSAVVVEKDKPLLARIFGDHMQDIGSYVVWDVLIPTMKSTVSEIISNGIEMILYGDSGSSPTRRRRGISRERDRSYVSYNRMYDDRPRRSSQSQGKPKSSRNKSRHQFNDITIETKPEAEEVLTVLVEAIDMYDVCTVADLYEAVGLPTDFTDHKWGWDNLSSAYVKRDRFGYSLVMPKPEPLE